MVLWPSHLQSTKKPSTVCVLILDTISMYSYHMSAKSFSPHKSHAFLYKINQILKMRFNWRRITITRNRATWKQPLSMFRLGSALLRFRAKCRYVPSMVPWLLLSHLASLSLVISANLRTPLASSPRRLSCFSPALDCSSPSGLHVLLSANTQSGHMPEHPTLRMFHTELMIPQNARWAPLLCLLVCHPLSHPSQGLLSPL